MVIDFEDSCYNFRGYDIGNLFNEAMYLFDCGKEYAYVCYENAYPSEDDIRDFLRYYIVFNKLKQFSEEEGDKILNDEKVLLQYENDLFEKEERESLIKKLLHEVKIGSLLSAYYWAVWYTTCIEKPKSTFDFLEIAKDRFQYYKKLKNSL